MKMLYMTKAIGLMFGLASAAGSAQSQSQPNQQQQAAQQQQQQSAAQQTQGQQAQGQQAGQDQQGQQVAEGQQGQRRFHPIDANNDGQISAEEATQHGQRLFSDLDQNGDGNLTRDEIGGQPVLRTGYVVVTRAIPVAVMQDAQGLREEAFPRMDQDHNGEVSRQEFMSYGEQSFGQGAQQSGNQVQTQDYGKMTGWRTNDVRAADRNQDNQISQDEAAADFDRQFSALDQDGNDQLSQDEWRSPDQQARRFEEQFSKLDANGDGKVDQQEFEKAGKQHYQAADINQDQKVSSWEYRTQTD